MITPNLGRLIALSKQYGSEVGSGGLVDWKTGYITTTTSSQEYDLDSLWGAVSESGNAIEIKRVFHQPTPAQTRFYDPQAGKIYIDGQEINKVSLNSLRKKISLVS